MCNYAAPKMDTIRIAIVGLGLRGMGAVSLWAKVEGVEIVALCDIRKEAVKKAQEKLAELKKPKAKEFYGDEYSWRKICDMPEVDLVVNVTTWRWHAPIALSAMEHGKHVAVEVPVAITIDDCWKLVETSERTRKHCVMLENCCYDFFEAATIQMALKGELGDLVCGEGAYIHSLVNKYHERAKLYKGAIWRFHEQMKSDGNLYPTHGLGPLAWAFGINRGDSFDFMNSISSVPITLLENSKKYASQIPEMKLSKGTHPNGNMNVSMIKTKKGRLIVLQYDIASERPYDRKHIISGTKGFVQKYPLPGKIAFGHKFLDDKKTKELLEKCYPELIRYVQQAAKQVGGHGGMDYIMVWRIVDCLRNGLPLDMDVYDAAAWSVVYPLSIWSVANRSECIDFPDFTCGNWRLNKPVDLSLRGGGSTKFLL